MKQLEVLAKMQVFICVNEREIKSSCAPTISLENYVELKKWLREKNLIKEIYLTKTGCLGFCNPIGGVISMWPQKKLFTEIESIEEIKTIILKEYNELI